MSSLFSYCDLMFNITRFQIGNVWFLWMWFPYLLTLTLVSRCHTLPFALPILRTYHTMREVTLSSSRHTRQSRRKNYYLTYIHLSTNTFRFSFAQAHFTFSNIENERAKASARTCKRKENETHAEAAERRERHRIAQARYREANRLQLRTKSWQDWYVELWAINHFLEH